MHYIWIEHDPQDEMIDWNLYRNMPVYLDLLSWDTTSSVPAILWFLWDQFVRACASVFLSVMSYRISVTIIRVDILLLRVGHVFGCMCLGVFCMHKDTHCSWCSKYWTACKLSSFSFWGSVIHSTIQDWIRHGLRPQQKDNARRGRIIPNSNNQ